MVRAHRTVHVGLCSAESAIWRTGRRGKQGLYRALLLVVGELRVCPFLATMQMNLAARARNALLFLFSLLAGRHVVLSKVKR